MFYKPYHELVRNPLSRSPERPQRHRSPHHSSNEEDPYLSPTLSPQRDSPIFERTTVRHIRHAKQVPQPIWEHLYREGKRTQQSLQLKREHSKRKIDFECTFQPLLFENKRYAMSKEANFYERNNIWQENKLNKMVREKEEDINRDLSECTFSPVICQKSKRIKEADTENKYGIRATKSYSKLPSRVSLHSPVKDRPKGPRVEIGTAKQQIRRQLKRILL